MSKKHFSQSIMKELILTRSKKSAIILLYNAIKRHFTNGVTIMSYIKDNFLLTNKTAEKLYFNYAKDMPIFDYHCHLPEKQILENKTFNDVYEIWLAGDHY